MVRHAADRRRIEEIGAVFEAACEPAVAFRDVKRQVELRRDGLVRQARELESGQPEVRFAGALQREHHLEQRIAAEVALGIQLFDELLEGQILVRERVDRALARALQQLGEPRIAGEIAAHDQRVDEKADEPVELRPAAAGDRTADGDVVLARVAHQQHLERGQQRHVQRGVLLARKILEGGRDCRRNLDALLAPAKARLRGTRPVGREARGSGAKRAAGASRRAVRRARCRGARRAAIRKSRNTAAAAARVSPGARRGRTPSTRCWSSRSSTPSDQPSAAIWCSAMTSTLSWSESRTRPARSRTSFAQVEGAVRELPDELVARGLARLAVAWPQIQETQARRVRAPPRPVAAGRRAARSGCAALRAGRRGHRRRPAARRHRAGPRSGRSARCCIAPAPG